MIYLKLLWTFFKLGAITFGGGHAVIGVIYSELNSQGWITAQQYSDIVAIAQITPGPVGLNAATYVGYTVAHGVFGGGWAGVFGAIVASFAIILPSFIFIMIIAHFVQKFSENQYVNGVLLGIRAVVIALIFSVAWTFVGISPHGGAREIAVTAGIFVLGVLLSARKKISVLLMFVLFGVIGILGY